MRLFPHLIEDSLEDIATALIVRVKGSIFCYYHPLDASGDICQYLKMQGAHLGLSTKVFKNIRILDFCILRFKRGWTSSSSQPPTANILTGTWHDHEYQAYLDNMQQSHLKCPQMTQMAYVSYSITFFHYQNQINFTFYSDALIAIEFF
ncbi:hypothetical protein PGT21_024702 [Puccinia graminis f. sp. tritici]|uniref:Uncharacterized protein n=1 Tax=Puccinia graminis f. sp. tritici TaxID=56615 RepID=A0A5B0M059_PUCGR|nr:hypothetical protein PGT21_024702 [Puccinia graminis f. sp. tritici]